VDTILDSVTHLYVV